MTLFHFFAVLGLCLLLVSLHGASRRISSGSSSGSLQEARYPTPVLFTLGGVGVLLLLASVPGAFFQQPHWLTNKIYWLVEKVIA